MKLRRIGNSLGTTFSKELLQQVGLAENDELAMMVVDGELRIRRAPKSDIMELSGPEITALAAGDLASEIGRQLQARAKAFLSEQGGDPQ